MVQPPLIGAKRRYNAYSLGWRMREQVSPIQRQKNDYQDTHDLRFRSLPIRQTQTRRTRRENGKSVNIKQRDRTQTRKDERIEKQRGMKMSVKKLNGRSCCAARHTREVRSEREMRSWATAAAIQTTLRSQRVPPPTRLTRATRDLFLPVRVVSSKVASRDQ